MKDIVELFSKETRISFEINKNVNWKEGELKSLKEDQEISTKSI